MEKNNCLKEFLSQGMKSYDTQFKEITAILEATSQLILENNKHVERQISDENNESFTNSTNNSQIKPCTI